MNQTCKMTLEPPLTLVGHCYESIASLLYSAMLGYENIGFLHNEPNLLLVKIFYCASVVDEGKILMVYR